MTKRSVIARTVVSVAAVALLSVTAYLMTSPMLKHQTVAMRAEPPGGDAIPIEPNVRADRAPSWGELAREAVHEGIPFGFGLANLWIAYRARKKWKMVKE